MSIKDGGPAFPVMDESPEHGQHYGMTLRDYFAAKELASASVKADPRDRPEVYGNLADHCYRMADAMIVARDAK